MRNDTAVAVFAFLVVMAGLFLGSFVDPTFVQ